MKDPTFVIFTKDDCEYCTLAKDLLLEQGFGFAEFVVPDCEEILGFMKYSNLKTVPQIFINGMLIGGYSDLESYFAKH